MDSLGASSAQSLQALSALLNQEDEEDSDEDVKVNSCRLGRDVTSRLMSLCHVYVSCF